VGRHFDRRGRQVENFFTGRQDPGDDRDYSDDRYERDSRDDRDYRDDR